MFNKFHDVNYDIVVVTVHKFKANRATDYDDICKFPDDHKSVLNSNNLSNDALSFNSEFIFIWNAIAAIDDQSLKPFRPHLSKLLPWNQVHLPRL